MLNTTGSNRTSIAIVSVALVCFGVGDSRADIDQLRESGVNPPMFQVVPPDKATVAQTEGVDPPPESELSYKVLYEMFLARNHDDVNADIAAIRYAQLTEPMPAGGACGPTTNALIRNEISASQELEKVRARYDAASRKIFAANPARRFHIRYQLPSKLGRYDEGRKAFPLTLSSSRVSGLQLNVGLDGAKQGGSDQQVLQGVAAGREQKLCNQYYNLLESKAAGRVSSNRRDNGLQGKRHDDPIYWTIPETFSFKPLIPNETMRLADVKKIQVSQERSLKGESNFPKFLPMSTADASRFIDRNEDRELIFDVLYEAEALSVRPAVWAPSEIVPEEAFGVRVVSLSVIDPVSKDVLLQWENDPAPPPRYAGVSKELQGLYHRYGAKTWRGRLIGAPVGYDDSGITKGAALRVLELAALKAHPELKDDPRRDDIFGKHFPYQEQTGRAKPIAEVTDEAINKLVAAAPTLPIPMVSVSKISIPPYDAEKGGFALRRNSAPTMLPMLNVASGDLIAPTPMAFGIPAFLSMSESEGRSFEDRLSSGGRFYQGFEVVTFDVTGFDPGAKGRGAGKTERVFGLRIKPISVEIYAGDRLTHKLLEYRPDIADLTALGEKAPLIREGADLPVANPDTFTLLLLKHAAAGDFDREPYKEWLRLRRQMENTLWKEGPWRWTVRDPWANFAPASLLNHADFPTDEAVASFTRWSRKRAEAIGDKVRFVLGPQLITGRHTVKQKDGVKMKEILGYKKSERGQLGWEARSSAGSSWSVLDDRFGEGGYYAVKLGSSKDRDIAIFFEIPEDSLMKLPMTEDQGLSVESIDFVTEVAGTEHLKVPRKSGDEDLFIIRLKPETLVWRDSYGKVLKKMKVRFE